jgi:hypothetical protein
MKITVDTNVLVRAVVRDNERQARTAAKLLKDAELIAASLHAYASLFGFGIGFTNSGSKTFLLRSRLCSTRTMSPSTVRLRMPAWRFSMKAETSPTV